MKELGVLRERKRWEGESCSASQPMDSTPSSTQIKIYYSQAQPQTTVHKNGFRVINQNYLPKSPTKYNFRRNSEVFANLQYINEKINKCPLSSSWTSTQLPSVSRRRSCTRHPGRGSARPCHATRSVYLPSPSELPPARTRAVIYANYLLRREILTARAIDSNYGVTDGENTNTTRQLYNN